MKSDIKTWRHSRKGLVRGRVVRDDGVWMHVELAGEHSLRYMGEANRGRIDRAGEVLHLRKTLMKEQIDG